MSIIDSIYESAGAFSIHVKDTDTYILMRGGEIDSIATVFTIGEMYAENLDCKVFSWRIKKLISASSGLDVQGILCFEFMDKHVIIKLSALKRINKLNPNFLKGEYEFIKKEHATEIKGGLYQCDIETIEGMN